MAATTRKHPAIPSKTPNKAGSGPAGVPNQYPTRQDAYAAGKALRASCPREAHADWKAPANRRDPVELVLWAEKGRVRDLLPLRHGRMVRSAFTFYRGAALTMAADLSATPSSWIRVQCCGDAHLCNFGGFATPERRLIFSINDLDETLPAPWEWDVKRLAASFVVACRDRGLKEGTAKEARRHIMMLMAAVMAMAVTSGQPVPPAPTADQLKNATYRGIYDAPIALRDGAYEGKPFRPDSPMRPRAGLLPDTLVTADLTGDGRPEAVVLLWKASGGSGVFTYVAVVANKGGKLENIATSLIGDREQVEALAIVGRRIVADVIGHGPGEPMCCPTQKQRRSWELTGTGLKELPKQVLGTVRLVDLEGKTWTLKSLDSDKPLPDGVSVTLTVKDGRAAGIGGCNNYSGPITSGDGARSLKIGPLISTRKFCEGVGSDVETKYLAALQGVFQFGFAAGNLALTYKEGDVVRTLMYSGQ